MIEFGCKALRAGHLPPLEPDMRENLVPRINSVVRQVPLLEDHQTILLPPQVVTGIMQFLEADIERARQDVGLAISTTAKEGVNLQSATRECQLRLEMLASWQTIPSLPEEMLKAGERELQHAEMGLQVAKGSWQDSCRVERDMLSTWVQSHAAKRWLQYIVAPLWHGGIAREASLSNG